jgi:hypothetical protein
MDKAESSQKLLHMSTAVRNVVRAIPAQWETFGVGGVGTI